MREKWIDTIRVMTAVWIYFVHYISAFKPEYSAFWSSDIGWWLVKGVTGKLGVAMFAILMGYFASKKGASGAKCSEYIVNRYLQFSVGMFVINIIKYIMLVLKFDASVPIKNGCISIIEDAVFLKAGICVTLWCMLDFFIASIVCFLLNRYKANFVIQVGICALLISIGKVWIAIGVMGSLVYNIQEKLGKYFKEKWWLNVVGLVEVFLLIKNAEAYPNNVTFTIQGIACGLFVLVMFNNVFLQRLFGNMKITNLGKYAFEIFLLSNPMLRMMNYYVAKIGEMSHLTFWISLAISLAVLTILAMGLHKMMAKVRLVIPKQ